MNIKNLILSTYTAFGGVSEFYALVFTVVGIVLAFRNELSGFYIALVTAIQTLIVANDQGNDYHAAKAVIQK